MSGDDWEAPTKPEAGLFSGPVPEAVGHQLHMDYLNHEYLRDKCPWCSDEPSRADLIRDLTEHAYEHHREASPFFGVERPMIPGGLPSVEALTEAIEGQNLYHGRHGTVPAGRTTAMAILAALRESGS